MFYTKLFQRGKGYDSGLTICILLQCTTRLGLNRSRPGMVWKVKIRQPMTWSREGKYYVMER